MFATKEKSQRVPPLNAALLLADLWARTPRGSGIVPAAIVVERPDGRAVRLDVDEYDLRARGDLIARVTEAAEGAPVVAYLEVERARRS